MRIGIIAALPGELRRLVRGWQTLPVDRRSGVAMWQRKTGPAEDQVLAVCAGMGEGAARRAFTAAEHAGSLDLVLSVGWAGALTDACLPSHCYVATEIIDAQTGERFQLTEGARQLRLVTTARVANAAEKRRLASTYVAGLVDMEAATVARLAQMRAIPVVCIKAVSDGYDHDLPDMNPHISPEGKLQMRGFLGQVATQPAHWRGLMRLGATSARAARALAVAIEGVLAVGDPERVNRTGDVAR